MNNKKISVLLADDQEITRSGIRSLLSSANDIVIVGEAQNGFEVCELVNTLNPDILLLDLIMPGPRPAEIEKWVRENHPKTSTLVLTAHDRDRYLAAMFEAGVHGYLSKDTKAEQLIDAIRRAARNEYLFESTQISRIKIWEENVGKKLEQLTTRETKVLNLLSEGADNKKIALDLNISIKTVAFHITHILTKLELKSRQEAALWARKNLLDNLE